MHSTPGSASGMCLGSEATRVGCPGWTADNEETRGRRGQREEAACLSCLRCLVSGGVCGREGVAPALTEVSPYHIHTHIPMVRAGVPQIRGTRHRRDLSGLVNRRPYHPRVSWANAAESRPPGPWLRVLEPGAGVVGSARPAKLVGFAQHDVFGGLLVVFVAEHVFECLG